MAAKNVCAPQKGMLVWAVWGSPVQRRALLPDVLPAVIMDVRRPVGLGASGPTVLVRWYDGSSAWTNVDFVNVYLRTQSLDTDQAAFDILYPEEAVEEDEDEDEPAVQDNAGQASGADAGEGVEAPVNLSLFSEIEEVEERLATEIERRETAESDATLWHERMEDAEQKLSDSQEKVSGLTLQLRAATDKLAVNAIVGAGPTLAEASTQVQKQVVAEASTQVEARVVTEVSTQVEAEPVVVAADAPAAADANPSTSRKRSKTSVYTPHDTLGRGGGAKHWKPPPDGGPAAGASAT